MRIIKQINTFHLDDRFFDINSEKGKIIIKINTLIGDEEGFLKEISKLIFWDFPKISLWSFENILNYLDELLSKYKKEIEKNEDKLNIIFDFYFLLFKNCLNKDIFFLL